MNHNIHTTGDGVICRAYKLRNDDIITISSNVISNFKYAKFGKYVEVSKQCSILNVVDSENDDTIGIVEKVEIELYCFKDVVKLMSDMFEGLFSFIFRLPKYEALRVRSIVKDKEV